MGVSYRTTGVTTYGTRCEICGHGAVEVHHIDYQEHQQMEDLLRYAEKYNQPISSLLEEAKSKGYLYWLNGQLSKDDRSTNLSCLCPNCHTLIHTMDVGKKLLRAIPKRV